VKIGDTVLHKPSGEQWVVARIYSNGDIIPAGWPCSLGRAEDIELVEECSEEAHDYLREKLTHLPPSDPRHIPPTIDHRAGV
jgi:hypothetical protein